MFFDPGLLFVITSELITRPIFVIPSEAPLQRGEVEGSRESMREHNYYVYILSNKFGSVLYVGMTNNLVRRVDEHRLGVIEGFTKKYSVKRLVYFEHSNYVLGAIEREKQLKRWSRKKKEWLIDRMNPDRLDLFDQLRDPSTPACGLRSG